MPGLPPLAHRDAAEDAVRERHGVATCAASTALAVLPVLVLRLVLRLVRVLVLVPSARRPSPSPGARHAGHRAAPDARSPGAILPRRRSRRRQPARARQDAH